MLNIFFSVALLLVLWLWFESKKNRYLYLFALLFGLSLSHHHIILFLVPAFTYLIYKRKKDLPKSKPVLIKSLTLFFAGLSPYLYVFWAAQSHPPINWSNVQTIGSFIRLISRADYGTFQSGPSIAQSIFSRFLQFPLILEFIRFDFTFFGIIFALVGVIFLYRNNRTLFTYLLIGFLSAGPLYFFYASYELYTDFSLGTLERFLLPAYIFIAIWVGVGLKALSEYLTTRFKNQNKKILPIILLAIIATLFTLPTYLYRLNSPKMLPLRTDFTAENYARDLLVSSPRNAILILQRDNALFNVQYIHFVLKERPDLTVIHMYRLQKRELHDYLLKKTPDLKLPDRKDKKYFDKFVSLNYGRFPILTNIPFSTNIKKSVWIRRGMLLELKREGELPSYNDFLKHNLDLWSKYHNPLDGALSTFRHWMPANVIDFYEEGRVETAVLFEEAKKYPEAIDFYKKAIKLDSYDANNYFHLSRVLAKNMDCKQALSNIDKAISLNNREISFIGLKRDIYQHCASDEKNAKKWQKIFDDAKKERQIKLDQL